MRSKMFGLILAAGIVMPSSAEAQVAWDAPMMMGPGTSGGLSVMMLDGAGTRDIGIMGMFRPGPAPGGMGIRGGVAEDFSGELSIFGGVDFSGPLVEHDAEFPLDVMWLAGAGGGVSNGEVLVSLPAGVSLGRVVRNERVQFTPYVGPRVMLDVLLGDERAGEDVDLGVAVDVGFDLAFAPSWTLRFASSIGDRDAILLGVALGPNR